MILGVWAILALGTAFVGFTMMVVYGFNDRNDPLLHDVEK